MAKKSNVDIPIEQTDFNILDETMCSVKELFNSEMKRMDEEMNKFSCDLMRLYNESSSIKAKDSDECGSCPKKSSRDSLSSCPLIEGEGKNKTMKLQFDVSQFEPCEVTVKILNESLVVSASHEEKCDNSSLSRQFHREIKLPKGVDPCSVHSTLSKDGVLTVQAPLPPCSPPPDQCSKC